MCLQLRRHSNSPLGIISLKHISLHIAPSQQNGQASSIILTLSALPLPAQDALSSQFEGNVKGIMAIHGGFMHSPAGRRRGAPRLRASNCELSGGPCVTKSLSS